MTIHAIGNTKIEFNKHERDCPHNTEIKNDTKSGWNNGRFIYDYEITVDGIRRGFWHRVSGTRYWLQDADGADEIRYTSNGHSYRYEAKSQADFFRAFVVALEADHIPTQAQLLERRQKKDDAERAAGVAKAEEARLRKIKDAGPELLAALKAICADARGTYDGCKTHQPVISIGQFGRLRAAEDLIAQTEGVI